MVIFCYIDLTQCFVAASGDPASDLDDERVLARKAAVTAGSYGVYFWYFFYVKNGVV